MTTINGLLDKAKRAIRSSDASLKQAAEYIAKAKTQGATQDRIARGVGKSQAWVSALLAWRREEYKASSPFGPTTKAARDYQHADKKVRKAKSEIAATTTKPTTVEQVAKFELQTARAQAVAIMFSGGANISIGLRAQLVAALMMLAPSHPVERVRRSLGMSWDALLVPATAEPSERSKAA